MLIAENVRNTELSRFLIKQNTKIRVLAEYIIKTMAIVSASHHHSVEERVCVNFPSISQEDSEPS